MKVIKRNNELVDFNEDKIYSVISKAFASVGEVDDEKVAEKVLADISKLDQQSINVETIQNKIEIELMKHHPNVARAFIIYRYQHKSIREYVENKEAFISKYKKSSNTANATIDDNSNVTGKNVGILNSEIHKSDNQQVNRGMVMRKLKELYPNFDSKQYIRDLESHIIYKHDESSFAATVPYCVSVSMYPFLNEGIKGIGGLSAAPKNIDSYCGMYVNLIFAVSSMFAGAVATSEFLLYFDYFARKEWGDDYYKRPQDILFLKLNGTQKTIQKQIHQYFQQVIYSINQPAAARGMQSAFVNFSYFDKAFFEGMFGNFYFPDGTQPQWESLCWLQKDFMMWFNEERTKTILTFPVESFAMVYKNGHFLDEDSANFVAEEYARGHSFFTYISDTVDSLASCCRLKNKVQTKEFNFTNGNMGVETGSKSVITLNLNRIIQDYFNIDGMCSREDAQTIWKEDNGAIHKELSKWIDNILNRVYMYHNAYNELLWDMYDAGLLPVYNAGFIDLNKQYMTIGINGLNEAAEYLGIKLNDNPIYADFCQTIFSTIKESNTAHKIDKGHKLTFNTECVPAESLAIKNYNWDKKDGYWVPEDRNLYASYIYLPSDDSVSILEKIRMHGKNYIGDYLDGGSAAHLNLDSHLSKEQYKHILEYAAQNGCSYLTFNVPNSECLDCSYITKVPIDVCPKCGSKHIQYYDRIIGYLTPISSWSHGRQMEQKTRVYEIVKDV